MTARGSWFRNGGVTFDRQLHDPALDRTIGLVVAVLVQVRADHPLHRQYPVATQLSAVESGVVWLVMAHATAEEAFAELGARRLTRRRAT